MASVTVRRYLIDPVPNEVEVEFVYAREAPLAEGEHEQLYSARLSQATPPLDVPDWGDGDVCDALADALGLTRGDVVMATPAPSGA